jgi:threonine dehydrogenase-like Zn-dependent dehydrogenase
MKDVQSHEIIADTEVLVKIKVTGICCSDVHIYHATQLFSDAVMIEPMITVFQLCSKV